MVRHLCNDAEAFRVLEASLLEQAWNRHAHRPPGCTLNVPRLSWGAFLGQHPRVDKLRPFVLENVYTRPPLAWDDLSERYGSSLVPVHANACKGANWHRAAVDTMPLSEAIRHIRSAEQPASKAVISCSDLLLRHPEVKRQLRCAEISAAFRAVLFREELFVSGCGASSAFHCEPGDNIFICANGSKQWILVAPQDSMAMYPMIGLASRASMFGSPINSETFATGQAQRYPLYSLATKWVTTLTAGDVLFVPAWWWHEVSNVTDSIGVPMRTIVRSGTSNNWYFTILKMLSQFGRRHLFRALVTHYTGGRVRLDIDDSMVYESFRAGGSNRPENLWRATTVLRAAALRERAGP